MTPQEKFTLLLSDIYTVLKPFGYKKEAANYRKFDADGLCKIINVQKSHWNTKESIDFTFNFGIYFEAGEQITNKKFKEYECHIRRRQWPDIFKQWWNIDENTDEKKLFKQIEKALNKILNRLDKFDSKEHTIELMLNGKAPYEEGCKGLHYSLAKSLAEMGFEKQVYELIKDTEPKHTLLREFADELREKLQ